MPPDEMSMVPRTRAKSAAPACTAGASTALMIVAYTLLIGWTIHFATRD